MRPKPAANSAAMPAPVGVMSSCGSSICPSGMPFKISIVAGAGTGKMPCAHFTVPWPSCSAETKTFSTPSASMPTHESTMSAMESNAPTS